MKLNFNGFALLLLLITAQFAVAQNQAQRKEITKNYDVPKLQKLQKDISETQRKDKEFAVKYALENNLDVIIEKPNGGVSILQKVLENESLIYITTYNEGAAKTLNTDQLYSGGNLNLNLSGAGIEMGIWDGGLVRLTHQEFGNRVSQLDDAETISNHATHVAGTMMAAGLFADAKGMAFESILKAYDFNQNLAEMAAASQAGMMLSNHSYGFDPNFHDDEIFGAYVGASQITDEIVYESPYHLMVFAAGNSNTGEHNTSKEGYDLLSGYNLSKNVLTVANVLEVNNYEDASSVTISNSSSWGPTDDGRIKPDISAKGTGTFSSVGVADNTYNTFTGTSMAAPNVSGSVALLQQHYDNLNNLFLNAASMKALVIHTAREAGDAPGPDYKFGWGLMDTAEAAQLITNEGFTNIIEETTLNNRTRNTFTVEAIDATQPLVVTIAWTDLAGEVQNISTADDPTPRLVNDLDLTVTDSDGEIFFPWKLDVENPSLAATQGNNSVDNVEKIEIPNAEGEYTIEVIHKGTLEDSKQDYTIVVSGIAVSNFKITSPVASETFCDDETATFDINLNSLDTFTEDVTFTTSGLPSELTESFSTSSITNEGTTTLSIGDLSSVSAGSYPFTVTATSGTETSTLNLKLKIESSLPLDDVNLLSPFDGEEQVSVLPVLSWESVSGNPSYQVQLATDDSFSTIILDETIEDTDITIDSKLESGQTYYWRVRPLNNCVTGSYSTAIFTTTLIECFPIKNATDTPISIETESPNTQQSIINFPENLQHLLIQDMKVSVDISHSWVSDLTISLVSPSGTTLVLLQRRCGSEDDIDVIFDDSGATVSCEEEVPTLSGIVKPQFGALAEFIGESPAGDWTLVVEDGFEEDGGSINNFGIELCYDKVENDDACDAIPLVIDAPSTGAAYTLVGATAETDEPSENLDGGVLESVWFSFEAPSFGSVQITTDIEGGTLTDSELAVYSTTNCEDFNTYSQIGYDNDSGSIVESGKMSVLNVFDLNSGETYYIQVDRSSTAEAGSFGIEVRSQTLRNTSFSKEDFQIYPNPTNGALHISGIQEEVSVEIFDLLGRKVMSIDNVNNNQEFDVQSFSSGVYLVKVKGKHSRFTKKIIKE